jgi:hypothetical protein
MAKNTMVLVIVAFMLGCCLKQMMNPVCDRMKYERFTEQESEDCVTKLKEAADQGCYPDAETFKFWCEMAPMMKTHVFPGKDKPPVTVAVDPAKNKAIPFTETPMRDR